MIELATGSLLEARVDALVNTVNTEGIMGKGVALQFRRAFPANYDAYAAACARGDVALGRVFVYETHLIDGPRLIINFPTKGHWRSRSRLEDIEAGLADLRVTLEKRQVASVALPALGCGLGGLRWEDVKPRIEAALGGLPIRVLVFPPQDAPDPERMPDARVKPKMTPSRAALIGLLARYLSPGEGATPLVVQKLLYFLQEAGEPMRLRFAKQRYGPYSDEARHLVQTLEGHFLVGYGDGTGNRDVHLLPGASEPAESFLSDHHDTLARFERVQELIDGFESPYGLELLATTHWAVTHQGAHDLAAATVTVRDWSARKKHLFTQEHIAVAWDRLDEAGWLANTQIAHARLT